MDPYVTTSGSKTRHDMPHGDGFGEMTGLIPKQRTAQIGPNTPIRLLALGSKTQ